MSAETDVAGEDRLYLGPAVAARSASAACRRRHGRGPAQLQPWRTRPQADVRAGPAAALEAQPARRRHPRRPAGPEDPAGQVRRTARSPGAPATPIMITSDDIVGTADRVSCTYKKLPQEVKVGDRLLVDDGRVALEVKGVTGTDISCLIVEGGIVSNHKGISLPQRGGLGAGACPRRTSEDLRFALRLGVDLVALSFVRSPEDIKLRPQRHGRGGHPRSGASRRSRSRRRSTRSRQIVDAFDGVMVARGDLGVEMPLDQVPLVQKRCVQLCREIGQAGHRRHPDARLDDRELAPDPRRGLRRRQRGARRRRRGDALRRDQRRQVPGAHRLDDGEDHRDHRGRLVRRAEPAARAAYAVAAR